MKNIIPFNYNDNEIRVTQDEAGLFWWVAKDVCDVLGLDPTALRRLDDDEKNTLRLTQGIQRGNPNVNVINEPGLYALILRSRKPEAKKFKRWVTHEVLPQIRKTGRYEMPGVGLMDEEAKKSNMVHYSVSGLCQEADKYLGGKAALTALNYFTGMPVDDLMEELEAQQAATNSPGQSVSDSVATYVKACCLLDPEAEVSKADLCADYDRYCVNEGCRNVGYNQFFRELYKIGNLRKTRKGRAGKRSHWILGITFKPYQTPDIIS